MLKGQCTTFQITTLEKKLPINITVRNRCKIITNNSFVKCKSKYFFSFVNIYCLIIRSCKFRITCTNLLFCIVHALIKTSKSFFFRVSPFNEKPFTCTISSRFFSHVPSLFVRVYSFVRYE
jgi:hypothetical protein